MSVHRRRPKVIGASSIRRVWPLFGLRMPPRRASVRKLPPSSMRA